MTVGFAYNDFSFGLVMIPQLITWLNVVCEQHKHASEFLFFLCRFGTRAIAGMSPVFAVDGFSRVFTPVFAYHVFYMIRRNTMVRCSDLVGPCEKKRKNKGQITS